MGPVLDAIKKLSTGLAKGAASRKTQEQVEAIDRNDRFSDDARQKKLEKKLEAGNVAVSPDHPLIRRLSKESLDKKIADQKKSAENLATLARQTSLSASPSLASLNEEEELNTTLPHPLSVPMMLAQLKSPLPPRSMSENDVSRFANDQDGVKDKWQKMVAPGTAEDAKPLSQKGRSPGLK